MKRIWVTLNEAEWRYAISALNKLRNRLIAEGRYTDVVDEVILKIVDADVIVLASPIYFYSVKKAK